MNIKEMPSADLLELLNEIKKELEIRKEGAEKYAQEQEEKERALINARTSGIIKKIRGIIRNIAQREKASSPHIFVNDRKGGKMVKVQFPFSDESKTLEMLTELMGSIERQSIKNKWEIKSQEIYESNRYGFGVIWSLEIKI